MDAALLCGSFARKHSCQVEDYLVNPESEGQESNSTSRCPLILPCAYPGLMATAGEKGPEGSKTTKKKKTDVKWLPSCHCLVMTAVSDGLTLFTERRQHINQQHYRPQGDPQTCHSVAKGTTVQFEA